MNKNSESVDFDLIDDWKTIKLITTALLPEPCPMEKKQPVIHQNSGHIYALSALPPGASERRSDRPPLACLHLATYSTMICKKISIQINQQINQRERERKTFYIWNSQEKIQPKLRSVNVLRSYIYGKVAEKEESPLVTDKTATTTEKKKKNEMK